ncbi:MAG: PTS sugar transporter subunit IIA, partial [Pseudoclavibacter sp.]
ALPEVHMFIGAMIMAPLAAWIMKQLDKLWDGKVRAGFEMLVNMFSAGIAGFGLAVAGFFLLAPLVNWLMNILSAAVEWLISTGLLPLVSVLIEPAKVFFLNNAINHGVLTPLGTQMADDTGKSILFLLEANPGPGLGILIAFTVFGVGAARATAPGAAIIQFFGGIHEIYFPYVLMKPALLIAVIVGGASGVTTNMIFDAGLRAPAAPGSIIAVLAQTASDSYIGVILSVIISAVVTFVIAGVILRASRKADLAAEATGGDALGAAIAQTEANKGKKSEALSGLAGGAAGAAAGGAGASLADSISSRQIGKVIFACDAGMGSSAMGANVLRTKFKKAGLGDIDVTNVAIANLDETPDIVFTHKDLTDRARQRASHPIHVSVDNFMSSPTYDEVVDLVKQQRDGGGTGEPAPVSAGAAAAGAGAAAGAAAAGAGAGAAETSAAAPSQAGEGAPILTLDRIRAHGTAGNMDDAIGEAASFLIDAGAVDASYEQAMRDREASVSTFMGNLLAIPHGTNEAKDAINASALSFVRYDEPIDWAGDEVRFVVGIAGKDGGHLAILQKIAIIFSDEAKVQELLDAPDEAAIHVLLEAVNEE